MFFSPSQVRGSHLCLSSSASCGDLKPQPQLQSCLVLSHCQTPTLELQSHFALPSLGTHTWVTPPSPRTGMQHTSQSMLQVTPLQNSTYIKMPAAHQDPRRPSPPGQEAQLQNLLSFLKCSLAPLVDEDTCAGVLWLL